MRRIKFEKRSVYCPQQIRLKGQWLEAAGVTPGQHVEVVNANPGELIIRIPQATKKHAEIIALFERLAI